MKKKLLLIDGSNCLYRAFHAMPDLRNDQGKPTGAIYGFIKILRKLISTYKTEYIACVFDANGKSFRNDIFPDYKSNRSSMPSDLAIQISPLNQILESIGIKVFSINGFEADDIIGTLSSLATKSDIETLIFTNDKDFAQLVNNHIKLINNIDGPILDEKNVKAKFGVSADYIVEYLMLVGDAIDNVPGVQKVGPITAIKWLNEFGSIRNLSLMAKNIKGVLGKNLCKAIPIFDLTRRLLTVKCDCDLSQYICNIKELEPCVPNFQDLSKLYTEYNFHSWLSELQNENKSSDTKILKKKYSLVTNWNDLKECLSKIKKAKFVGIDIQTTSKKFMQGKLLSIAVSLEPGKAYYIPLSDDLQLDTKKQISKNEILMFLRPWLEDSKKNKVFYHAKYNIHIFANDGINLTGIIDDIMLKSYVLEACQSVNLDNLIQRFLGYNRTKYNNLNLKNQNYSNNCHYYSAETADIILQINYVLRTILASNPSLSATYALEMDMSDLLAIIERNGVKLDLYKINKQNNILSKEILSLERKIYNLVGKNFNINSPKQLCKVLFEDIKLPILRKTLNGKPSTDEKTLKELAVEYLLPNILLEYRKSTKLKSNYTDKLPKMINQDTGRIHTYYSQTTVITGRLASSNPNLQNIPVRTKFGKCIRQTFISEYGMLLSADYSQIELRIMAHISNDFNLKNAFFAGKDIHQITASEIFKVPVSMVNLDQRRIAKVINFGLMYGMGVSSLASNLGIGKIEAKNHINRYFNSYPGIAIFMEKTRHLARKQGYLETMFGRRLQIPEINSDSIQKRKAAERMAINAPIQGTAADLIKMAMIAVQNWINQEKLKARIIIQIHDELILEISKQEQYKIRENIPNIMCNIAQFSIPLITKVKIGKNWGQLH